MRIDLKTAGIVGAALAIVLVLPGIFWLRSSGSEPAGVEAAIWASLSQRMTRALSDALSGKKLELILMCVLVLTLELLAVGWRKSAIFRLSFRPRYTAITDALFFLTILFSLSGVLAAVLTLGLSVGTARMVNWTLAQYGWFRINLPTDGVLQISVGCGIYWLAMSFFQYWIHRLMHTPLLWHLHRFHHAATELNIITVFRQHPLEPVLGGVFGLVSPLVFFNVSDQILLVFFVVGTTFDLLGHSQLPWEYGWFGRWIIASPRVHQIHHSAADEHRDMHFSNCPLWDHLFGTWYKGPNAPVAYGIPDNQYEVRPLRQFVGDAIAFYTAAARGIGASLAPSSRAEPS